MRNVQSAMRNESNNLIFNIPLTLFPFTYDIQ